MLAGLTSTHRAIHSAGAHCLWTAGPLYLVAVLTGSRWSCQSKLYSAFPKKIWRRVPRVMTQGARSFWQGTVQEGSWIWTPNLGPNLGGFEHPPSTTFASMDVKCIGWYIIHVLHFFLFSTVLIPAHQAFTVGKYIPSFPDKLISSCTLAHDSR
jgi:hypothetical protein